MAPPYKKRLFVFCDGTDQDGLISWEVSEDKVVQQDQQVPSFSKSSKSIASEESKSSTDRYASNVFRLSRCIALQTEDGVNQIVLYQSGVGVPDNFEADNRPYLALVSGTAVAAKIRDAYNFIVQNYAPGDEIYLFGFSRGAYTVRKVAGLLDELGLLDKTQMSMFFRYWKNLSRPTQDSEGGGVRKGKQVQVEFLGVWDTVGSIRTSVSINPAADILGLKDNSLPECVKQARHAMCYYEERSAFLCIPFKPDSNEERLAQVWFPGVHSDVGGGYQEHQIADLSLLWMAGELAEVGVTLDNEYLGTRLSSGKNTLEVHHEYTPPLRRGNRHAILEETMKYPSTYYHRSMWAKLEHVEPARQDNLDGLNRRLRLIIRPDKMRTLNELEHECWASRWAHYIPNPLSPQRRGGGAEWVPTTPPFQEHNAPEEEESPSILFE